MFGLLGPNGAGKTTFVKIVVGLMRPSSGSCWVSERRSRDARARRGLGYVPELFQHEPSYSANEVCGLHAALAGVPRHKRRAAVDQALETVGLKDRRRSRVRSMSKGMQQRLSLAAAIVGDPSLVVLDEPTSALDPVGRAEIRSLIRALRDQGRTVFLSSHLLAEVEQTCTHVAVLDRGSVVLQGPMSAVVRGTTARLSVSGLDARHDAELAKYGGIARGADGWIVASGLARDDVALLVAEVGRLGGQVHDVRQEHQTLEDRFLEAVRAER